MADTVRQALLELDAAAEALGLDRPLLNVLLTDGRTFVAHRAGMPLHLSTQKLHCAEAPRCPARKVCLQPTRPVDEPVNHMLVASEPTATDDNLWEPLEDGATLVLDEKFALKIHRATPGVGRAGTPGLVRGPQSGDPGGELTISAMTGA